MHVDATGLPVRDKDSPKGLVVGSLWGYVGVTGEARRYIPTTGAYSGVRPEHPVGSGGWGAWELAARYSYLDLNSHATSGVAPIVTGYIVAATASFSAAFIAAAVVLVIGILAYVFLLGRLDPIPAPRTA